MNHSLPILCRTLLFLQSALITIIDVLTYMAISDPQIIPLFSIFSLQFKEDMVQALKEKEKGRELEVAPKPEPTTEVLFLCSYEGCGKTFTDVAALRKHANIHGDRQHICNYPGCGKVLLFSNFSNISW